MGKSTSQAKIKFNQNQLYPGALLHCDIDLDNSTCKNDVDYVQMYLVQTVKTKPNNMYSPYHMDTQVCKYKSHSEVKAKQQKTEFFNMAIPESLGKTSYVSRDKFTMDEFKKLTPSFNGKQLVVTYELELTIKHKGWNTDGKGNAVKLPIWIHSSNPKHSLPQNPNQAVPLQPIMPPQTPVQSQRVGYPMDQ